MAGRSAAPELQPLSEVRAVLQTARDFRGMTVVPGAGHWVQYERADAFNAALMAALD